MFGFYKVSQFEQRTRKVESLRAEYPNLTQSEALDCLITAKWDETLARKIIAAAAGSEMDLALFLAMLDGGQK
jgi:hypothetical protein